MSAFSVPISLHGVTHSLLSWPQLFAVWIAIGLVALVIGFAAVRASTRRVRRSMRLADEVTFASAGASKPSVIRATA